MVRKVLDWWDKHCGSLLAAAGLTLIAWGVWRIYPPAGNICMGVECLALGGLIIAGKDGEDGYGPD